ncbi:member of major facilitator multidrug-resistance DHA1 sub-family [Multifurca ochricompacta]|uniref:Member of major facilitator multidrug-resistance DHA1 sub-family n=1 Tax=Multifurca ochricompacta TaxID=376703 RepID=A0AAD4QPG6_9AGAM|nr:member of major facilitator multidrug-resistance DHA1 sub-family [Multifurca ochricompacta]
MSPIRFEDNPDEETPLFQNSDAPQKPTPLPKAQILILLSVWLAESIVSHSISPYINQLVRDLPIVGGDYRKVGYYTGIIVSLHYAAAALTTLHWNRLSDYIGRKPVLLSCFMGTIVSITMFSLSHSFWALALSRCLHGAMNGHVGVVKSMITELTDETNVAQGFSLLPVSWALGYVFGPLIGGFLSQPQHRWPNLFSNPFWAAYPYFLPCLGVAAFTSLSFIISAVFLKETMNHTFPTKFESESLRATSYIPQEGSSDTPDVPPNDTDMSLPLRSVLTRPVVITTANFAIFALLNVSAISLIPLVWSTPIKFGGLNLSPASIGLWMSGYGCINGIFQFAFFSRMVGRFGPQRVFIVNIAAFAVVYAMLPLENLALRHAGGGSKVTLWILMFIQMLSLSIAQMGFSSMYLYISSAAPNKRSLGSTIGLADAVASTQVAVGPVVTDCLFAFSLTNNVLGGNFVYVVLFAFVGVGLCVAGQLPRYTWRHGHASSYIVD